MKKFLLALICLVSFSFFSVGALELPEKTDHEKVTIYIFRGSGCGHCYEALTYFYDVYEDYSDFIEIKAYETWNNESNHNLYTAVAKELGDNADGVPYIVIGDSYHTAGFATQMGDEIISAALKEYENKKYKDVVAEVAEDTNNKGTVETLEEACIAEGIIAGELEEEDDKKNNDGLVIVGIFAIVVGGIVALVGFSRKK